jgi:anthranilate phosphoribosyltransferase
MNIQFALNEVIAKQDLSRETMREVMQTIMGGSATPAQIAGFVIALRCKGESVTELAAAAEVMRELAAPVTVKNPEHLIDTCGTGGDGARTFNVSSAAAIVAAAAGAMVAKHGGRSVSSSCGSADVMEALGVNIALAPSQVSRCIDDLGIGFIFAPNHHSAMKFAAPVRRELGVRTLFNLLGPMTNPAGARRQIMGVFASELVAKLARVLKELKAEHVLVVHSADGLDEMSLSGETLVAELKDEVINEYVVAPEDFGLARASLDAIRVADSQESSSALRAVLNNEAGPTRDIVCLNAGAAIYVAGLAPTIKDGLVQARALLATGAARRKLDQLVAFSQALKTSANAVR